MFGRHEISPTLRRRLNIGLATGLVVVGVLLAQLWNLQVLRGPELRTMSENNRIRLRRVQATRGRIVDRYGRVLVESRASFDAVLVPEDTHDLPSTVENLAQFLQQGAAETQAILDQAAERPPFQEVPVRRDLNWDQVVALETHQIDLPGVSIRVTPSRSYPHGPLLSHLLGYLGEINKEELARAPRYRPGDFVGKSGLEKSWESALRGVNGGQQIEVDAFGRELRVLQEVEATPGNTLVLSVDLDLQRAAEQALGARSGAVVALDPRNGEVLAMVSYPPFDPNLFARGIMPAEWRGLVEDAEHPLNNRALQGQYPPGSTFKIVVAAAALEEGIINPFTRIGCHGGIPFGNHYFRCWRKEGHGSLNVHEALVQSCDVFFYQVGQRVGIDTIAEYARAFGLGAPTGISLENEMTGTIPDSDWKHRRFGEKWYAGETLSCAVGQGYVTATPLQMAQLIATAATGVRYRPHLVRQVEAPTGEVIEQVQPEEVARLPLRRTTLEQLHSALEEVVMTDRGTGKRARLPGVTIAGKTGTAQVVKLGNVRLKAHQLQRQERDHAWFISYAPAEDPTIAVAALVEHADGGGGAIAAPLVHDVLQEYFRLQEEREPRKYAQH